MARPVKFDYDSDTFYDEVFALAFQGMCDAEIADALEDRFGESLDPDTFSAMKGGRYAPWSKEENERRSSRLNRVLARARRKTNAIVRGRYLKAALGGIKTKNVSKVKRPILNEETGEYEDMVVQINESEFESPPNIQAMSVWLYHHDPEWRRIQKGIEENTDNAPDNINHGIDIQAWIRKEMESAPEDSDNVSQEKEN